MNDEHTPTGVDGAAFERDLARLDAIEALERLTPAERLAAYRRNQLALDQLVHWSAAHPDEVPKIGNEFEWIVRSTPDWAEAAGRRRPRR
jgi:hypothetical protein